MHKDKYLFTVFAILGSLFSLWTGKSSLASDILILKAAHLDQAPKTLKSPIWNQIQAVPVPVQGREVLLDSKTIVSTQVAYTKEHLHFKLKWKDPTQSVVKQSWKFDGQKWQHQEGNEDRIALLFEITRISKFATRGCAITCHSPPDVPSDKWKLTTATPEEKGDLWHWKAARSAPYNHADDAWLTIAGNPTGSYRETGRRKDTGTGGDIKNQTQDKSKPIFMQDTAKIPIVPGFLLMEEAVKIDDYSIFKAGDTIPFRLPVKPSGSRFDVKTESQWKNGYWTVIFSSKLSTGNEDDVNLNQLKRYSFALAVFDNSGADHSKATQPMILTFGH
jgi:hypothetical protein